MSTLQTVGAVAMIILSLIIIFVVLMQKNREANLSSTISGGDSSGMFEKTKNKQKEAFLENLTKIFGVIFFIVAIAVTGVILFVK